MASMQPVLCKRCNFRWKHPAFGLLGDGHLHLSGELLDALMSMTCPRCGDLAVLDVDKGLEVEDIVTILNSSGRTAANREALIHFLRSAANDKAEQIESGIMRRVPMFSRVASLIPRTTSDRLAFLAVVITLATLINDVRASITDDGLTVQELRDLLKDRDRRLRPEGFTPWSASIECQRGTGARQSGSVEISGKFDKKFIRPGDQLWLLAEQGGRQRDTVVLYGDIEVVGDRWYEKGIPYTFPRGDLRLVLTLVSARIIQDIEPYVHTVARIPNIAYLWSHMWPCASRWFWIG